MSFENLYDGLADGPLVKGIKPFEFSDADAEEARAIGLTQSLAAAYATPAKPPRIIRHFDDVCDRRETVQVGFSVETEYRLGDRKLLGYIAKGPLITDSFLYAGVVAERVLNILLDDPQYQLIAVVYAKCN